MFHIFAANTQRFCVTLCIILAKKSNQYSDPVNYHFVKKDRKHNRTMSLQNTSILNSTTEIGSGEKGSDLKLPHKRTKLNHDKE